MLHRTLTPSKSSPNLVNRVTDKAEPVSPALFITKSTEYVNSPPIMTAHKALIQLFNKYAGNKGDSLRRAFSLRPRKMKKIEDIYKYCNPDNTFTLKIRKSSIGLGMYISGGKDSNQKDPFHELIRISNLHPEQPALECGKLTLGDVILAVNGKSLLGMTYSEAAEVIRNAPVDVVLKIFRPSKYLLPSLAEGKGNTGLQRKDSRRSSINCGSHGDNLSKNTQTNELTVTLLKQDGCLGFSIVRQENVNDYFAGIFIKALTRQHAIESGKIKAGDKILQVNGRNISGFSHADAINFLRNAPNMVTLKLCRICNEKNSCEEHSVPEIHTFTAILEQTPNEKLGFCVWNSIDSSTDTRSKMMPFAAEVKFVFTGSLAYKNGIKVGDRILEVNGVNVLGKTADEVSNILRKSDGTIRLVLCRL